MTDSSPLLPPAFTGGHCSLFLWRSGALLTFVGMLTGAFGAHGLERRAGITTKDLHAWETASNYAGQIANGLGLMLVSMHHRFSAHRFAGPAMLTGGVLFSASIMALVLTRLLGPVTPLGGLIMMAGYLSLVA